MTKAPPKLLVGFGPAAERIVELFKLDGPVTGLTFSLNFGQLATLEVTYEVEEETAKEVFEYITKHYNLLETPQDEPATGSA
jgi:hypothetical protein